VRAVFVDHASGHGHGFVQNPGQADGMPGNPPGTAVGRAVDNTMRPAARNASWVRCAAHR